MKEAPLCSACIQRGDRVPLRVGHQCIAADPCDRCGHARIRKVVAWNSDRGFFSVVDPCSSCVAEAKRAFQR